uniref:Uncharacterized protein n=1 Tax=Solanum lycopersicum TaxID=4081 RepID=K4DEH8_SOLLC
MLAHRLKTVDNGYMSEDGEIDESINEKEEVKPQSNHSVVKPMENDSDFVEDAIVVTDQNVLTLMLPYGNALHSLLSESNIQLLEKVSQSSKEPSVVKSAKVGERFSGTLSSFDDVHMLAHRLKTMDNGETNIVSNHEIDNPRYILICFQED